MASLRALARHGSNVIHRRRYHDYIRFETAGGSARIPLRSPNVVGTATSRGTREYQEDHFSFVGLSLNPEELRHSVKAVLGVDWDPALAGACASQAVFVGLYDGHGGSAVSQYLRQELHGLFENVQKSSIPETYAWIREIGGYFRRYDGGPFKPWLKDDLGEGGGPPLDVATRAALAFFTADRELGLDNAHSCGATASVVVMQALDTPQPPFFLSKKLALTVAHVGDTRVVLCNALTGKAHPMTDQHHAESRVESSRLRRSAGAAMIADSFGETRFMGALANTRCIGDLRYKPFGVTPEPEIRSKLLENGEWAFVVLVSDGISQLVSDPELCGLARNAKTPKDAAAAILAFAEEMGAEDNATALVLPLAGWGNIHGPDTTVQLRQYRQTQMIGSERQRRM